MADGYAQLAGHHIEELVAFDVPERTAEAPGGDDGELVPGVQRPLVASLNPLAVGREAEPRRAFNHIPLPDVLALVCGSIILRLTDERLR